MARVDPLPAGDRPQSEQLLEVSHLSRHFLTGGRLLGRGAKRVRAVDDVSFTIGRGETVGLVGESGCGKTTLGRSILGLLPATSGEIRFAGRDISRLGARARRELRRDIQAVFQDPLGALNPRMTVGAAVEEPLRAFTELTRAERRARVGELFELVGLDPGRVASYPRQMSGGQLQRVGIARAIAARPRFIVADEVVSALDVSVQAQIINLLVDLRDRQGLAYLFIAHDLAVVRHISHRVAVMYLGRIVELAESESLFAEPHHPYTGSLLDAVQEPDPGRRRAQPTLGGELPATADVPTGCRFRTRCPFAEARCAAEEPELREVKPNAWVACHFPR